MASVPPPPAAVNFVREGLLLNLYARDDRPFELGALDLSAVVYRRGCLVDEE